MWHSEYKNHFQSWNQLTGEQREEFFIGDEYLPLPETHADRIRVLQGTVAREFIKEALAGVPGYSSSATSRFTKEESILLSGVWNDQKRIQEVRDWLHHRGLSYSTPVHLLYDDLVVETDWKIVVRYWDALAWSVGVEMLALDSTKSWTCSFHHEDVVTFYSCVQAPNPSIERTLSGKPVSASHVKLQGASQ
jgi:hypothetical protein